MIELNHEALAFSFPEVHPEASLKIRFLRTLRVPDDGRDHPLPPGFEDFPLRHIDDHAENLPTHWLERGGVILPMYQSEAMWMHFHTNSVSDRATDFPFAIKVATGKINAITGERWDHGLSRNPQDYMVSSKQPWLDGYAVEKGIIRQFVAMPLGEGFSVEEQLTGKAEFGGLQIEVFPMKREAFERRFPSLPKGSYMMLGAYLGDDVVCGYMGLAPGGRMRQEIYQDPFNIHDWDTEHSSRCFVHIVNSLTWKHITGERPPGKMPTAADYTKAGLPWFDYYDADAKALGGSKILAKVKSVHQKGIQIKKNPLPENTSITDPNIISIKAKPTPKVVREYELN